MIPPRLPSLEELKPALDKLEATPGSCVAIIIEHGEPVWTISRGRNGTHHDTLDGMTNFTRARFSQCVGHGMSHAHHSPGGASGRLPVSRFPERCRPLGTIHCG